MPINGVLTALACASAGLLVFAVLAARAARRAQAERDARLARLEQLQSELALQAQQQAVLQTRLEQATAQADATAARGEQLQQQLHTQAEQLRQLHTQRDVALQHARQQSELHARGEQQLMVLRETLAAAQQEAARQQADNRALQSRLDAEAHQREQQKQWFEEQSAHLRSELQTLTQQILEEKGGKFTALQAERLGELLNPLKAQISEFKARVEQTHLQDAQDRSALKTQVEALLGMNRNLSEQTLQLTRALTTQSKAQGDWGEFILKRLLEESGLREGHEYHLQLQVVTGADAEAVQRPDAVIQMPENRQLIIDAKVSLTAWTQYCSEPDEAARAQALKAHLLSLRGHIRELAAREYPHSPDLRSADFVVMFVPIEAALLEALRADAQLYDEAFRRKVVLVTPTTLFAVIRLIEGMWSVQRREEHAERIAEVGRKLYDKLVGFVASMDGVGQALGTASKRFDEARGQLASGRGNAIRLAEQMRELGVTSSKSLPADDVQRALREDSDGEA